MSLGSTFSGFRKREAAQKSTIAPNTRRSVSTSGVMMLPAMTIFATGAISPQMQLAASIAPWPFQLIFSIFLNKSAANVHFFLTLQVGKENSEHHV